MPLEGKKIVFTGKLSKTQGAMRHEAQKLGAIVKPTLSRKVDILVCGERVSAKHREKAQSIGVDIMKESEYQILFDETMQKYESFREEIENFMDENRKAVVSPARIEYQLKDVVKPQQWEKIQVFLQSDSEAHVAQGILLLSGLEQIDAVSTFFVQNVTGRYNLPIRSQLLAAAILAEIEAEQSPYLIALVDQGLINPLLLQAAAHTEWGQISTKHQRIITEELERVHQLPAGEFWMGIHNPYRLWRGHEMSAHKVRITQPFWCSVYPWSQILHEELTGSNPSTFIHPTRPVEMISMYEAMHICNLRSIRDGLAPAYELEEYTPSGNYDNYVPKFKWLKTKGWRLPTEAEWEYAARAYQTCDWAGSNNASEVCWDGQDSSQPIGLLKPNAWGLSDMCGNTGERCWDAYDQHTYQNRMGNEQECTDPWFRNSSGALSRGGCWGESSGSFSCAVFGRGATGASIFTKNKYVGIRMVRNV